MFLTETVGLLAMLSSICGKDRWGLQPRMELHFSFLLQFLCRDPYRVHKEDSSGYFEEVANAKDLAYWLLVYVGRLLMSAYYCSMSGALSANGEIRFKYQCTSTITVKDRHQSFFFNFRCENGVQSSEAFRGAEEHLRGSLNTSGL